MLNSNFSFSHSLYSHFLRRISLLIPIFFLNVTILSAQCPTINLALDTSPACLQETISLNNTSDKSLNFSWDFCSGSLQNNGVVNVNKTESDFNNAFDIDNIYDILTGYHTFLVNRSNGNLIRLDYENGINSSYSIINLGNLNGLILDPQGITIIKEGAKWFGIISTLSGDFIKISFGNNILSIPVGENLGMLGGVENFGEIEVLQLESEVLAFSAGGGNSTSKLLLMNFGNTIENNPIVTISDISGGNLLYGLSLISDCTNWYGLLSGFNSGLMLLEFGNDIKNTPIVSTISGVTNPRGVKLLKDAENYYGLTVTQSNSSLFRLNFGGSINSSPTIDNLGDYSVLNTTIAFDAQQDSSVFRVFTAGFTNSTFTVIEFEKNCIVNKVYSTDFEPNNIFYNSNGTYNITAKSYINKLYQSSKTFSITISTSLAPQLSCQITGNCLSSPINFSGQQISGNITNWNWNFGDGSGTSTLQNASYSYGAAGEYQVRLNVTDANGCNNLIIDTVQVYEEPVPNFTIPGGNLCMNNEILFANTTTGESGNPVTWTWDFNSEGSSSEREPNFTFLTGGSKTITLTSSIPGCANVTQQTITIEEAPTTAFTFNNTCNSQTTTFTDETAGNNLTTWNWDFGDGNSSITQSPVHTYASPGKYIVKLNVSNNLGCTTTKVDTVYNHAIPVVNFSNDLACSTSPVQFTDQSMVANTNLVAWEWNFGDGTTSTEQSPQYLYNQVGDFTVKLKAYSQFGCVDSTETVITVAQGPQVDFEWDKACQGESTSFTDLTNSFGVSITNWNWIVDGSLLTNQHPTYTFTHSGTYTVQLSVTVNNLCAQTMTQDIIVEVPPTVLFDYSEGCGGAGTTFYDLTDQIDDPIIVREWRVDGSVISTDSSTTTLLDPGTYAITLSVITNSGCEETTTSNVSLIGSPVAAFEVNTIYGSAPLRIDFSNLSTGGSTYEWSFGDSQNTTSSESNPIFNYTEIGLYIITLRTSSDPACYDETTQQIEVVEAESSAEIIAITPSTTNDITNFVITIENSGTNIIDNTANLVFRADYGTEVIEPINTIIYAGKTVNYTASYAIPSNSNAASVCVELIDSEANKLDRSCVNINGTIHISEPYPNPSKGRITVDVMIENPAVIKVRVINRSGQSVLSNSYEGQKGLNNLLVDAQALPQGLYIIEIATGDKIEQFKTSIVR